MEEDLQLVKSHVQTFCFNANYLLVKLALCQVCLHCFHSAETQLNEQVLSIYIRSAQPCLA